MAAPTINLFKETNTLSPKLAKTAEQLRRAGITSLVGLFSIGAMVGVVYGILVYQRNGLVSEKEKLEANLTREARKEGLYASLRDRIEIVKSVRDHQQPVTPAFDIVTSIATPPVLTTLSVKSGVVEFGVLVPTIDEALTHVGTLIGYEQKKKLKAPKLTSFGIAEDGRVSVGFSFEPIF